MKLRVRFQTRTVVVSLDDSNVLTVLHVKNQVREILNDLQLPHNTSFALSLNGKTSIGNDGDLLSAAGIVSGDLLKVLISDEIPTDQISSVQDSVSMTSVRTEQMDPVEDASNEDDQPGTSDAFEVPCYHPGPLLLQDYKAGQQLPDYLQQLYSLESVKTDFHAICLILHSFMLESGFILQGLNTQLPPDLENALKSFVVNLEYKHPAGNDLHFSMTCNPLGQFVLVNGLVRPCSNTEEQVLTLQVKSTDFVKKFNADSKPSDSSQVFKDLTKLAHSFKENVAYRAIDNMRAELQLPPIHGMLSLFPELLLRILSHLDVGSLCAVSQTCRILCDVAKDDNLWRSLLIKDFNAVPREMQGTSWKEVYMQRYKRKQQRQQERQRIAREQDFFYPVTPETPQFPGQPFGPNHPTAQPFPGQPLGMIGGDYDLDPTFPFGPLGGRGRANPFNPNPIGPMRPGPHNPLPGSRFDPMNPHPGGFRPGRGGGMMDDMNFGLPGLPNQQRNRRGFGGGGFGGFM
uniref:F-box only protein 7 n=1 Tax=Ciona intestinalis TaxID=7719 RepID=F6ZPT5_CIOIN|nr:F-box only protein 7 [Ciona intestinalis]|eukprot:XP_002131061.1 F-box only protein 7 [Ciona intestinalis]